jgi:hypothetical protein
MTPPGEGSTLINDNSEIRWQDSYEKQDAQNSDGVPTIYWNHKCSTHLHSP